MGRDLSLTPELQRTRAGPTKAWDPVDQYKGRTVDKWQRMRTRPGHLMQALRPCNPLDYVQPATVLFWFKV